MLHNEGGAEHPKSRLPAPQSRISKPRASGGKAHELATKASAPTLGRDESKSLLIRSRGQAEIANNQLLHNVQSDQAVAGIKNNQVGSNRNKNSCGSARNKRSAEQGRDSEQSDNRRISGNSDSFNGIGKQSNHKVVGTKTDDSFHSSSDVFRVPAPVPSRKSSFSFQPLKAVRSSSTSSTSSNKSNSSRTSAQFSHVSQTVRDGEVVRSSSVIAAARSSSLTPRERKDEVVTERRQSLQGGRKSVATSELEAGIGCDVGRRAVERTREEGIGQSSRGRGIARRIQPPRSSRVSTAAQSKQQQIVKHIEDGHRESNETFDMKDNNQGAAACLNTTYDAKAERDKVNLNETFDADVVNKEFSSVVKSVGRLPQKLCATSQPHSLSSDLVCTDDSASGVRHSSPLRTSDTERRLADSHFSLSSSLGILSDSVLLDNSLTTPCKSRNEAFGRFTGNFVTAAEQNFGVHGFSSGLVQNGVDLSHQLEFDYEQREGAYHRGFSESDVLDGNGLEADARLMVDLIASHGGFTTGGEKVHERIITGGLAYREGLHGGITRPLSQCSNGSLERGAYSLGGLGNVFEGIDRSSGIEEGLDVILGAGGVCSNRLPSVFSSCNSDTGYKPDTDTTFRIHPTTSTPQSDPLTQAPLAPPSLTLSLASAIHPARNTHRCDRGPWSAGSLEGEVREQHGLPLAGMISDEVKESGVTEGADHREMNEHDTVMSSNLMVVSSHSVPMDVDCDTVVSSAVEQHENGLTKDCLTMSTDDIPVIKSSSDNNNVKEDLDNVMDKMDDIVDLNAIVAPCGAATGEESDASVFVEGESSRLDTLQLDDINLDISTEVSGSACENQDVNAENTETDRTKSNIGTRSGKVSNSSGKTVRDNSRLGLSVRGDAIGAKRQRGDVSSDSIGGGGASGGSKTNGKLNEGTKQVGASTSKISQSSKSRVPAKAAGSTPVKGVADKLSRDVKKPQSGVKASAPSSATSQSAKISRQSSSSSINNSSLTDRLNTRGGGGSNTSVNARRTSTPLNRLSTNTTSSNRPGTTESSPGRPASSRVSSRVSSSSELDVSANGSPLSVTGKPKHSGSSSNGTTFKRPATLPGKPTNTRPKMSRSEDVNTSLASSSSVTSDLGGASGGRARGNTTSAVKNNNKRTSVVELSANKSSNSVTPRRSSVASGTSVAQRSSVRLDRSSTTTTAASSPASKTTKTKSVSGVKSTQKKTPDETDAGVITNKVSSRHPDLVTNSASEEQVSDVVARLESLCEARLSKLREVRAELRDRLRSVEALTCVIQQLNTVVDESSSANDRLRSEYRKLQQDLQDIKQQLESLKSERESLEKEIERRERDKEREIEALRAEQTTELNSIIAQHEQDMQTVCDARESEFSALRDAHEQEMEEMKSYFEQEQEARLADLEAQHNTDMEEITRRFDAIKVTLSEKVECLRGECDEMRRREKTYMEQCEREAELRVQDAMASFRHLPEEIESLKAVLELRRQEIQELRHRNQNLQAEREELSSARITIKNLEQKVENLEAIVNIKQDYERQLAEKHQQLLRRYDKESKANKRLSMDKEELLWKLNQSTSEGMSISCSPEILCHSISRSPPQNSASCAEDQPIKPKPSFSSVDEQPIRTRSALCRRDEQPIACVVTSEDQPVRMRSALNRDEQPVRGSASYSSKGPRTKPPPFSTPGETAGCREPPSPGRVTDCFKPPPLQRAGTYDLLDVEELNDSVDN